MQALEIFDFSFESTHTFFSEMGMYEKKSDRTIIPTWFFSEIKKEKKTEQFLISHVIFLGNKKSEYRKKKEKKKKRRENWVVLC